MEVVDQAPLDHERNCKGKIFSKGSTVTLTLQIVENTNHHHLIIYILLFVIYLKSLFSLKTNTSVMHMHFNI
jgi:hypothetical protein